MAVKLSFDDLTAKVDGTYQRLEFEVGGDTLVFAHPLRKPQAWREEYAELFRIALGRDEDAEDVAEDGDAKDDGAGKGGDEPERDEVAGFRNLLDFACEAGDFDHLAGLLGDDAAMWVQLFLSYVEAVSAGEASPSDAS